MTSLASGSAPMIFVAKSQIMPKAAVEAQP